VTEHAFSDGLIGGLKDGFVTPLWTARRGVAFDGDGAEEGQDQGWVYGRSG
jgi:hypothetical protein